jgi:hypothetical protein
MPLFTKFDAVAGSLVVFLSASFWAAGQTTQCVISGGVIDSITGKQLPEAKIEYWFRARPDDPQMLGGTALTDRKGFFILPLLSPGTYRIRASKTGYQSQEVNELQLFVASALRLDFPLRPASDVWDKISKKTYSPPESDVILDYYAADVQRLESAGVRLVPGNTSAMQSTLSYVIDSQAINDLPLNGRDVYTILSTIAGATSDATTARSLGLAVNGQRPSSSNFLLDGVENDNYLVTGPLALPPPEAVQEYRISTNNFSAEYGRTGGYLANAITASGQNSLHGTIYSILENDILNANDFQNNLAGQPRTPLRQWEPGLFAGGALIPNSLFASFSADYFHFGSRQQTQPYVLPSPSYRPADGTLAGELLRMYPVPAEPSVASCSNNECTGFLSPPSTMTRWLVQPRGDYLLRGGPQRFMARLTISRMTRPDFLWTPYQGFSMPLNENVSGFAGAWSGPLRGGLFGEVRFGWSVDDLRFDRPHPEVPLLSAGVTLPGSPAFYGYRNRSTSQELIANGTKIWGRHIVKFGGGFLPRQIDGYLTAGRDGVYFFDGLSGFVQDQPNEGLVSLSRLAFSEQQIVQPDYNRNWVYRQFFLYFQDTYKLAKNLVLNLGIRYENYGAPRTNGASEDAIIQLGSGTTLVDQLAGAKLAPYPNQLFGSDNNNWGVRTGIAWSPGNARTVLRGGFGIYYDRPFDNLWENLRNNNNLFGQFVPSTGFNYLTSFQSLKSSGLAVQENPDLAQITLTLYDPNIRNAKIYNYFAGAQHQLTANIAIEVNGVGSAGRNLITTDIVNRSGTCSSGDNAALFPACNSDMNLYGRVNTAFPNIRYRSSQGISDYNALTAVFRYRAPIAYFQAAYAWSHTIDIQSEPLAGDFFDLEYYASGTAQQASSTAAFTRQFMPNADRANSDFDQRHNLAFFSMWNLPSAFRTSKARSVFRDWRCSQLATIRSGLPFSVLEVLQPPQAFSEQIFNNRANIAQPNLIFSGQGTASKGGGGVNWFNPPAFTDPSLGQVGNYGRNAFRGPGFYSLDVSLSRGFAIARLGETARFTIRADAFNFLNHANLNNPVSTLDTQGVGVAKYGRVGTSTGFPAATPFTETGRQIQLQLRLAF